MIKTFLYLTLITLAEASIGVFVKLTGNAVPVYTLNFYRVGFAFLFLLATVPFIKRDFWEMDRYDIKPLIFIGLFIALQVSLFNIAMTLAPIANVVILWSISPFFVFIFGPGELTSINSNPALGVDLPAIVWVLGLGVFSTGVAYLFISLVLKSISANVYSLVDIIVSPVVAAIFGYLVFGEVPSNNMIYGGILLLSPGIWLTWNMSNMVPTATTRDRDPI